jgi:hypothetical protein
VRAGAISAARVSAQVTAQVTASLALLKKTLPDLSAVDHGVDAGLRHEDTLAQLDGPRARHPAKTAR